MLFLLTSSGIYTICMDTSFGPPHDFGSYHIIKQQRLRGNQESWDQIFCKHQICAVKTQINRKGGENKKCHSHVTNAPKGISLA